jgi:hypothetical protein
MASLAEIENRAGICRMTAGWKKQALPLEWVRRYWRDVHSPAISRRAGIYDYRHMQYDPVCADVFAPVPGIGLACPPDAQLMWTSDVRYRDDAALALFGTSPDGDAKAQLLGDIDLIVDRSTTYKAVGDRAVTYVDNSGNATPQGAPAAPSFAVFLRQQGDEPAFHAGLRQMAARWAKTAGVIRLRLSLFEAPDMEAERKAGYPIKTHPVEQQYQAWIDLTVADEKVARGLLTPADAAFIRELHAYPIVAYHTFVYDGRPTLAGLRGYPAVQAIEALRGFNQTQKPLLKWMYGDVIGPGPVDGDRT